MSKKRISILLVSSITLQLLVLGGISFHYYQKDKQNRELFINHFHYYVQNNGMKIERLIEEQPTDERLNRLIQELEIALHELTLLLDSAMPMVDRDIDTPILYLREATNLLQGAHINRSGLGDDNLDVEISAFTTNGKLNEQHIALLNVIRKDFQGAEQDLFLEELREPNLKLTVKEINQIINNHFTKSVADIYLETQN